ncbi:hypothetical protein AVEN_252861-1 [Araneus ventricosus]|uniref:Uncharacterized protein n=1 Tax=Araneus ventricosus TaxID=182803 RepID=A0A4Y2KAR3_ARAVE|nr:hypothetical protein AVEN_252861-1 [Araneus ventricosus]
MPYPAMWQFSVEKVVDNCAPVRWSPVRQGGLLNLGSVMSADADVMRQDGPTVFTQAKHMIGIEDVVARILKAYQDACEKP